MNQSHQTWNVMLTKVPNGCVLSKLCVYDIASVLTRSVTETWLFEQVWAGWADVADVEFIWNLLMFQVKTQQEKLTQ